MYPRLFGHPYLNTFGVCIVLGLVACFVIGRHFAKVRNVLPGWADFAEGNAYLAIVVGAIVSFVAQAWFFYREDPMSGFRVSLSATFISGLIGGVASYLAGYFAYGRRHFGPRLVEVCAIAPVCITIAHAFGRLGCFFAGCCYGKPTDSFLGIRFPHLIRPVHPTQLYESVFLFTLFGILYYLVFHRRFSQGFALYLFSYGVFRFFIEFLRGDHRGAFLGGLSPSQPLAIALVLGSLVAWFAVAHMLKGYRNNASLPNKIDL